MTEDKVLIVKLSNTNYSRWKYEITDILKAKELWEIVTGEEAKPTDADLLKKWNKKNSQAKSTITQTLDDVTFNHVCDCDSAKGIWVSSSSE